MKKEGKLYTVEGTIRAMRVVPGVLNLVEDIQKGALFTGVAAGLLTEEEKSSGRKFVTVHVATTARNSS